MSSRYSNFFNLPPVSLIDMDTDTRRFSVHFKLMGRRPPVRAIHETLPFEIMSAVFRHVPTSRRDLLSVQELGEVCPIWKNISEATPELWTFFCLSFPPNEAHPKFRIIQAYHWLSRSKALPCELEIDMTRSVFPPQLYQTHIRPLLASIATKLSIFWFCGGFQDCERLFQNLPESFPELRSLAFVPRRFQWPLKVYPHAFRKSKRLEELTVSGILFKSLEAVRETVSVKGLTALVLEGRDLSPELAYAVFCAATNLVRCTISVYYLGGSTLVLPSTISGVSHPRLQELTLGYLSTDFAEFLRPLQFPSLTKLTIKGDPKVLGGDLARTSVSAVLLELHRRSPFSLVLLNMKDVMVDVDEFVTFLKLVPMLVELRIDGVNQTIYLRRRIRGLSTGSLPIMGEFKVAYCVVIWTLQTRY